MVTVIAALLATFAVGVFVGLLCSPGTTKIDEAYTQGFIDGCNCSDLIQEKLNG